MIDLLKIHQPRLYEPVVRCINFDTLLQTSKQQVRRMIQSGELTAVRVGREYRVPIAALETWPALQSFLIAVVTPLFYVSE